MDIDENGVDDILTIIGAGTAADLRVRLGAGDGTFADTQSFRLAVLLGNGDGTFAPATSFDAGSISPSSISSISLAGVNNDGITDILSANQFAFGGSITALIGAGDGTFSAGTLIAEINGVKNAVADDINADGLTDIVATGGGLGTTELVILFGQLGGGFAAPVTVLDESLQGFVALEDVDGDQNADIIASGGLTGSGDHIYVLLGNGAGGFAPALRFAVGAGGYWCLADTDDHPTLHRLHSRDRAWPFCSLAKRSDPAGLTGCGPAHGEKRSETSTSGRGLQLRRPTRYPIVPRGHFRRRCVDVRRHSTPRVLRIHPGGLQEASIVPAGSTNTASTIGLGRRRGPLSSVPIGV